MNNKHKPNIPIENVLKANKRQADANFQHSLEQQLIARLHDKFETNEDSIDMAKIKRKQNQPRSRLPLTLAVAVIAILLVGGMLLFITDTAAPQTLATTNTTIEILEPTAIVEIVVSTVTPDSASNLSMVVALNQIEPGDIITGDSITVISVDADTLWEVAQNTGGTWYYSDINEVIGRQAIVTINPFDPLTDQNTTDEDAGIPENNQTEDVNDPTFNNGLPIMIASRDIAVGETITDDMVYRVFFPRPVGGDILQRNQNFSGFFGNVEDVVGTTAITPIRAFTPINDNAIAPPEIADENSESGYVLPSGYVAVSLPIEASENTARPNFQQDDTLRIYAALRILDVRGDYPATLAQYVDSNLDVQQIVVSENAIVADIDTNQITLALRPDEAEVLTWLVESSAPITFAYAQNRETDEANITAYYLPPEGFIGDYSLVPNGSDVRVVVYFPTSPTIETPDGMPELLASTHNVLQFEAFVNIGTYSRTDEDGNTEVGTSGRLLLDVAYADMLDALRLHAIPYTYDMFPIENDELVFSPESATQQVTLTLPADTSLLQHVRQGDEVELIMTAYYDNSPEQEALFSQAGLTPPTQSGEVTLLFDNITVEQINIPSSENPIQVVLSVPDEDTEFLNWTIENGTIEMLQRPYAQ